MAYLCLNLVNIFVCENYLGLFEILKALFRFCHLSLTGFSSGFDWSTPYILAYKASFLSIPEKYLQTEMGQSKSRYSTDPVTVTNDLSMDRLRKILEEDFNFLPNWVDLVDPQFDYDFCGIDDSGTKYYRGGERYYRPIGWKRFALKVTGRYENDDWLQESGSGAWIVAYHGTEEVNCNPIASEGFLISTNGFYGPGVYLSPLIKFASAYARPVILSNGLRIVAVLQTRVRPGSFSKHHQAETPCPKRLCEPSCKEKLPFFAGSALEYVVKDPQDIRPYGICVKVLSESQASVYKKEADNISSLHSSPKKGSDVKSCVIS